MTTEQMDATEIMTNPIVFFEFVNKIKPHKYQIQVLKSKDRKIVSCWPRQSGKSTVLATLALYTALTSSNEMILIVAPFQDYAKIVFDKVKQLSHVHPFIEELIVKETATEIVFDGDNKIMCKTVGVFGKSIKGRTPTLLMVDEGDGVPDDAYDTLEPSLMVSKGRFLVSSTPWYPPAGTRFDSFFSDSSFLKIEVKASECPTYDQKEIEEKRRQVEEGLYPREKFEIEYNANREIGKNMTFFISRQHIIACVNNSLENNSWPNSNSEYVLGVDIAGMGSDLTILMVGEVIDGKKMRIVKICPYAKQTTQDIISEVKNLDSIWSFSGIYIDNSPMSKGVIDMLSDYKAPLIPVPFTPGDKARNYSHLKHMIESKFVEIPNNSYLIKELCSLMPKKTSYGISIQPPPRQHDDYADTLMLCCLRLMEGFGFGASEEYDKGLFRSG